MLNSNDQKKVVPLSEKFTFIMAETGYFHLQVGALLTGCVPIGF
jgi:hypothetical protein